MKIHEYAFHKCPDYWICTNPINNNWYVCKQKDPLIIVEFDPDTQTGTLAGIDNVLTRKIANRKQYSKHVKQAIAFTKEYISKQSNK